MDAHRTPDELAKQVVYDMGCLRHMLGIRESTPKKDYGFRNYFNSSEVGPDYEAMLRLESQGLVTRGRRFYWHATEAGCKAVGLNDKQTKRAIHGD